LRPGWTSPMQWPTGDPERLDERISALRQRVEVLEANELQRQKFRRQMTVLLIGSTVAFVGTLLIALLNDLVIH
jgi:hypothetical protein